MSLKSINPFNGNLVAEYEEYTSKKLDNILESASCAYADWKNIPIEKKSELLLNVALLLRKNKNKYAEIMSAEMGKCITEAIGEVEKSAWVCEYYAEKGKQFLQEEKIETNYPISKIIYQPIGCILAIMPWNFPFWQVFRFAAPNLMAGNTGILKHASNVSGCSLIIEDIFLEAGFPEGVFKSVLVRGSDTSRLIEDKRIAGVTLTGSTEAGKKVAESAGRALKKTVLELGGSDPYLILEDADVKLSAQKCAAGRLLNAGQSCIGAKRFIVHKTVYDEFVREFTMNMKSIVQGNPLKPDTTMGPMANKYFRDELHEQVMASVKAGACLHLGGFIPEGKGAFYPATIITNVKKGMPAYHEELFGPVASVIKVKNTDEAIRIANDSIFGLGAAVFSKNTKKAEDVAEKIESGAVFINDFVKSDPRLPFGGIKESGYGRELSLHGFREFMNVKTIAGN